MSKICPDRLETLRPDSRLAAAELAKKYGLRRLEQIKAVLQLIPDTVPGDKKISMVSEISGFPGDAVIEILRDLEALAPGFCSNSDQFQLKEVLGPPVAHCLNGCRYLIGPNKGEPRSLLWHHDPTVATLYTIHGKTRTLGVVTLRCKACESRFGYQHWSKGGEFFFYPQQRDYVKVTQSVYVPRTFAEFVSNTVYYNHGTYEGIAASFQNSFAGYEGFTRQIVSLLFLRYEVECDLSERSQRGFVFKLGASILQYIPHIIPEVFAQIYHHQCSDQCLRKNCGYLYVADGVWKMGFRHCKATVVNTVDNVPLLRFPNVCTNACKGTSEYCSEHEWMATMNTAGKADEHSAEVCLPGGGKLIEDATGDINVLLAGELDSNAATLDCTEFNPNKQCVKNKGAEGRSYNYSRGYLFVVRCTGHIEAFGPLFRAESLGQVFLFVIGWLYQGLQTIPLDQWKKVYLAYDNICQLSRLKAAREPLPLPAPYDRMWGDISKIVDGLHIQNHKDPRCKTMYDPGRYYVDHPEMKNEKQRNTMAAEQTFSWLANFRKQANAMPKDRQIFFVHRLVVRRNAYLSRCVAAGAKPVGGGVRGYADRGNCA